MRNLDKQKYRLKCKILATKIARLRLKPHQIPEYLSRQKWFMELQGITPNQKCIGFAKNGAFKLFGREWCDKCMREELIRTEAYEGCEITRNPEDIDSYYDVKLSKLS